LSVIIRGESGTDVGDYLPVRRIVRHAVIVEHGFHERDHCLVVRIFCALFPVFALRFGNEFGFCRNILIHEFFLSKRSLLIMIMP